MAKYFDKKASSFLHPSIESVVQHFESDAQHFYMTLKSGIYYIVYVCPFLGSYKSVAQHFQSVAQHFYMTLKSGIHYIVYVCPFLGLYKSVAQHFQSVT